MSGFTDAFYHASKARLNDCLLDQPKPYYNTGDRFSVFELCKADRSQTLQMSQVCLDSLKMCLTWMVYCMVCADSHCSSTKNAHNEV
jgi:hypothetical protein